MSTHKINGVSFKIHKFRTMSKRLVEHNQLTRCLKIKVKNKVSNLLADLAHKMCSGLKLFKQSAFPGFLILIGWESHCYYSSVSATDLQKSSQIQTETKELQRYDIHLFTCGTKTKLLFSEVSYRALLVTWRAWVWDSP